MKTLMGNSAMPNYIKLTALVILFFTYMAALLAGLHDYYHHGTIDPLIAFVLGTGLGIALQILGIHSGAQLAENVPPVVSVPPPVPVQIGKVPDAPTN